VPQDRPPQDRPPQAPTRPGGEARPAPTPQDDPPPDQRPRAPAHPDRVPGEQVSPASLSLGLITTPAPTSQDRMLSRGRRPPRHTLFPVPSPPGRPLPGPSRPDRTPPEDPSRPARPPPSPDRPSENPRSPGRRSKDRRHPDRTLPDLPHPARMPPDPACQDRRSQDPRPPGRQSSDHRHPAPTLPGPPRPGRPVPAPTLPPDRTPPGNLSYPGGLSPDRTHPCRPQPEGSRPGPAPDPILSQGPRPPGRTLADVPLPEGQAQDRTASPGPTPPKDPRYPGRPAPRRKAAAHRSGGRARPLAPARCHPPRQLPAGRRLARWRSLRDMSAPIPPRCLTASG
jgi:hypothetical protein